MNYAFYATRNFYKEVLYKEGSTQIGKNLRNL